MVTKKLASWAAIIAVPTLITAIYGMNFKIPEYNWPYGHTHCASGLVEKVNHEAIFLPTVFVTVSAGNATQSGPSAARKIECSDRFLTLRLQWRSVHRRAAS